MVKYNLIKTNTYVYFYIPESDINMWYIGGFCPPEGHHHVGRIAGYAKNNTYIINYWWYNTILTTKLTKDDILSYGPAVKALYA